MHNHIIANETQTFGFDFNSTYLEHADPAPNDSHNDTAAKANLTEASECMMTVEEMAEELRSASNKIIDDIEDPQDDDGIAIEEIIANRQHLSSTLRPRSTRRGRADIREEDQRTVEDILADVLSRADLAVSRGILWGASLEDQIWKPLQTDAQISAFLHGLGIRRYGNTVRWLAQRVTGDPNFRRSRFFEKANLYGHVAFADGLLNLRTNEFRDRTLADRVTAVLSWSYAEVQAPTHYDRFVEAMHSLAETEEAYLRLQELSGVALHAEPSGRILYFQHPNPRIASIFTTLIAKSWSEEAVTFLSLRDIERSFRTAQVLERPIVISNKEGESTVNDLSTVLALVDGNGVNTDRKHMDPFDFVSRASFICAGRNLPSLSKTSTSTMRYFLVRSNLTGELPEGTSVRELLSYVCEFAAWALEGLRRFLENGGRFTFSDASEIAREDNSIAMFVGEFLQKDPEGKIPSSALYDAYQAFCMQKNMPVLPKPRVIAYLKENFQIVSQTIRVPWYNEGNPVFGYLGFRFTDAYLDQILESDDSECESCIPSDSDEEDDVAEVSSWVPEFEHCGELNLS